MMEGGDGSTSSRPPDPAEPLEGEGFWRPPGQLGFPEAVHAQGTVAAPMLGGFCLVFVSLLLPTMGKPHRTFARWDDLTLWLLVAATVVFVVSVQCALVARSYQVVPSELLDWTADPETGEGKAPWHNLRRLQRSHLILNERWGERSQLAFQVGIGLLGFGLAAALVPTGEVSPARWALAGTLTAITVVDVLVGVFRRLPAERSQGEARCSRCGRAISCPCRPA